MKKNAFTLLELIFVISILFIVLSFIKVKNYNTDLVSAQNTVLSNLKLIRYQALIDNKYSLTEKKWFKKQWTFKFRRCGKDIGGFYYLVYTDENMGGKANHNESLKDPLSNKYLYSTWKCKQTQKNSKYVLLTELYNIESVNVSCRKNDSLGKFSFSYDGKVFSSLSNQSDMYIIKNDCEIKLNHKNGDSSIIIINKNGYTYIK
ncbi:MAG: type II secretion system GspH family protein [Campylobacterales bacterium]|nr:type II secretion system GspH family protein [Campylobacterales bacterium]